MPGGDREERKKEISDVLDRYERMMGGGGGGDGGGGFENIESREFREYKEAERIARKKTWYEKLVNRTAFFRFTFEDMEEDHQNALRLLNYDISPDQIGPAAVVVASMVGMASVAMLLLGLPLLFNMFILLMPVATFYYMVKYPALKARQKVIEASESLIMAILYMVIYMRSTPNLEGAVSFAAQHLEGPVANDLKLILWELDVRRYSTVSEALEEYVERWKPYNKGFVESLSLVMSSTREANPDRRNEILTEAIDRLLSFTRDQMEDFAQTLKLPIMVLYGIGILLPVLGIILFPLIATFMGGGGMAVYLAFLYNIILPGITYILMRNLLVSRPISFSSKAGELMELHPGQIKLSLLGKTKHISMFFISVPLFLLMISWPAMHYYNILTGTASFPIAPGLLVLLQEMMLTLAIAIPVGVHLVYGYKRVLVKQREIQGMEEEFPEALYELGNQLDRGQPIELAVAKVESQTKTLRISDMFGLIGRNIQEMGMTFKDAVFDSERGAITEYPSSLIATVMRIIDESTKRGPRVAAQSVQSISQYLKNIAQTQRRLEELLGDTLSSLKFLAYVLAPVIAGIAVGMGSVISLSFSVIGGAANVTNATGAGGASGAGGPAAAPGGFGSGGSAGLLAFMNFDKAIPPGLLQLIVGVYLIELAILIGMLYVRLESGKNPVKRNVAIGKILMSSILFYTITVLIIVVIFGGIIQGVQT